jgi:5-formyltetrahydrofolate cyclo-ligase
MPDNIKAKKELLRHEMLAKRDALSAEERLGKSSEIVNRLLKQPDIIKAKNIFTYVSFRSEVNTHGMLDLFLDQGKAVSVPFTDMNKKMIIPSIIKSVKNDLVPGTFGISEPVAEKLCPMLVGDIDIVIMPGAAFSDKGCRIGYGGGFYDRFLQKKSISSYALAFDFQIIDEVPFSPEYDVKVDYIVTEKRIIETK